MKRIVSVLSGLTILFFVVNVWLLVDNASLRKGNKSPAGSKPEEKAEPNTESLQQEIKKRLQKKFKADLVSYKAQIEILGAERDELKRKLSEVDKAISSGKTAVADEAGKVKKMREELLEAEKKIKEMSKELYEKNIRLDVLEARLKECERRKK